MKVYKYIRYTFSNMKYLNEEYFAEKNILEGTFYSTQKIVSLSVCIFLVSALWNLKQKGMEAFDKYKTSCNSKSKITEFLGLISFKTVIIFTESAHLADSVCKLRCQWNVPSVHLFYDVLLLSFTKVPRTKKINNKKIPFVKIRKQHRSHNLQFWL